MPHPTRHPGAFPPDTKIETWCRAVVFRRVKTDGRLLQKRATKSDGVSMISVTPHRDARRSGIENHFNVDAESRAPCRQAADAIAVARSTRPTQRDAPNVNRPGRRPRDSFHRESAFPGPSKEIAAQPLI